jgi:hypothetical protein
LLFPASRVRALHPSCCYFLVAHKRRDLGTL